MKVAIVGASGETGGSIVNGLLNSPTDKFEITALVRESSLTKPETIKLRDRGVKLVTANLEGPPDELVQLLSGIDVVISAIHPEGLAAQIPLANAAKSAGVKRFVPCVFGTVSPPRGVMQLRDMKEDSIDYIKKIHLPYTIIDVGWWYQVALPRLPSGRIDYAVLMPKYAIAGDGSVPSALTDLRDIGQYVARIIADPRTLNKMVFAYNEVLSQNQIFEELEKLSGEKIDRQYMSENDILAAIAEAQGSKDLNATYQLWPMQYLHSWGIRGDNTPQTAQYLGYLDAKELYPDFKGRPFAAYITEVLEGKAKTIYEQKMAEFKEKLSRDSA